MSRLVLTRKIDEEIIIHNDAGVLAKVKVSKVDRNQVRLTFEASSDIKIDRLEIFQKTPSTIN
jgi:carbon storage regulator CsrA